MEKEVRVACLFPFIIIQFDKFLVPIECISIMLAAEKRKRSRKEDFGNEFILPYIERVYFYGKRNRWKNDSSLLLLYTRVVISMKSHLSHINIKLTL